MAGELAITQADKDGVEVVKFQGEITAANSTLLTAGVAEAIKEGKKLLLFDLREVSYISSVGTGALTQSSANLNAAGGRLAVVYAEGAVEQLFHLTHLERALNLYQDEALALKSFVS